jgi:hypothetical protein
MEILGKLFGSTARVKVIRLFLLNPGQAFSSTDIVSRTEVSAAAVRRELNHLTNLTLIKRKTVTRQGSKKKKKNEVRFTLNTRFSYLAALQHLVVDSTPFEADTLIRRLGKTGRLKAIVLGGIFKQNQDSSIDLLVVGDHLNKAAVDRVIHTLESELGSELRYAVFETSDFSYRLNIYDKLIRDDRSRLKRT